MRIAELIEKYLPFFLNHKQLEFKQAKQKFRVWLGGRGSGKTNIEAETINDNMDELPGSKGFLYGIDLVQMKTKEVVELQSVWERMGMVEWTPSYPMGDYVIGIKPPKGFKVVNKYKKWENVVSFPDGCTIELISQNQRGNRGGSYDWGVIVEASLLKEREFWKDIYPMVRGNQYKYDSVRYLSLTMFSNMPWLTTNYWIPDLKNLAEEKPDEFFFLESTIYDNISVLGEKLIEKTKAMLMKTQPLVWKIEYMNQKNAVLDNAFYNYFNDAKHTYLDNSFGVDPLHNPNEKLLLSIDFNDNLNTCTAGQYINGVRSYQKEFYTYANEQYTDLATQVNDYYSSHQIEKVIHLMGCQDGHDRKDINGKTYFNNIRDLLMKKGWIIKIITKAWERNPDHYIKHFQINEVLKAEQELTKVKINQDKCPFTIKSIMGAQRLKNGKKDKSSEKKLKGLERLKATDLSDTFDYGLMPYIGKHFIKKAKGFTIDTF